MTSLRLMRNGLRLGDTRISEDSADHYGAKDLSKLTTYSAPEVHLLRAWRRPAVL
jgi:hypothetical protein